ncbi:MAG: GNAT family N-acetyltransferase [Parachlamydiales bacterium]|nr:GNAT family N-acetyltransferase [Parachlamydiales bacterium]
MFIIEPLVFEKETQCILEAMSHNMLFQTTYFSKAIPQMCVVNDGATIVCTRIDDDNHNLVMNIRFTEENFLRKIAATIEIFTQLNLPFYWWIGPLDTPYNLREGLLYYGLEPRAYDYAMYLNLACHHPCPVDHLHIKRVLAPEDMKVFCSLLTYMGFHERIFDMVYSHIPPYMYQEGTPYELYIGYVNDKPVTAGVLVFHANVCGIYYIVTDPKERKKGYATEMIQFLLNRADQKKGQIVVLQASEAGKRIYEKMGFTHIGVFEEFYLSEQFKSSFSFYKKSKIIANHIA